MRSSIAVVAVAQLVLLVACTDSPEPDVTPVEQDLFGWGESCQSCPSSNCPDDTGAVRCGANGIGSQPFLLADTRGTCAPVLHCEPRGCRPNEWIYANYHTYDCRSPGSTDTLMIAPIIISETWPEWANGAFAMAKWWCLYHHLDVLACHAHVDRGCAAYAAPGTLTFKRCIEAGYAACDLVCT